MRRLFLDIIRLALRLFIELLNRAQLWLKKTAEKYPRLSEEEKSPGEVAVLSRVLIEAGRASDADLQEVMDSFRELAVTLGSHPDSVSFLIIRRDNNEPDSTSKSGGEKA